MDKTILFLVPFHLEQAEQINIDSVSTENDLYEIPSFDLIGFWEGAAPLYPVNANSAEIKEKYPQDNSLFQGG